MREIELRVGGVTAVAQLLADAAPRTCDRIWDALPIEETLHNLRYGGNATFVVLDRLVDASLPIENRVFAHQLGTLAFRPEYGEIILPYGPSQARDPRSVTGWATVFARLSGNADALLAVASRIVHEGSRRIVVARRGA